MNIKRNNWTNQELARYFRNFIFTEEQIRKIYEGYPEERIQQEWNKTQRKNVTWTMQAEEFEDMDRPEGDYSAKGMDTDTGIVYMVGPKLPQ